MKGWKSIPIGGKITEAGNSKEYKTGGWKSFKPIRDDKKCINCMICWINCPDLAIKADKDGNIGPIDLDYCKGCGICAKVCPVKCIKMVPEK